MVNRGGKRKKKRQRVSKPTVKSPGGRFGNMLKISPDATMVLLGIMQLGLGLVFMALLANFFNHSFAGQPGNRASTLVTQTPDRPFSPLVAYGYTIFTFCLWTLLIARRYRLGLRQLRFLTVLYMPGTLMAVWILYRFFAAVEGGN